MGCEALVSSKDALTSKLYLSSAALFRRESAHPHPVLPFTAPCDEIGMVTVTSICAHVLSDHLSISCSSGELVCTMRHTECNVGCKSVNLELSRAWE